MRLVARSALFLAFALLVCASPARAAMSKDQLLQLLRTLDYGQRKNGDNKSLVYVEQKEKDKTDVVREAIVYRRSADQKLMILFTKPKSEQGKGYLRLDKNLWSYDPNVGKWERRTERERIAGTDSRRADFDESRLAGGDHARDKGGDKVGVYSVHKLSLKVKDGVDVAFPVVKLWVDNETSNILKRQEFALSGRLMRTVYYPRWQKQYSESKKGDFWYPPEIRIYDEVEKA